MEKTNLSKRVVAGTLALLTVFGSAPASLQGVFAPSTLTASAVDYADEAFTLDLSKFSGYITSVKVGGDTFTTEAQFKRNRYNFVVLPEDEVEVKSKLKLNFEEIDQIAGEATKKITETGTPADGYTYTFKAAKDIQTREDLFAPTAVSANIQVANSSTASVSVTTLYVKEGALKTHTNGAVAAGENYAARGYAPRITGSDVEISSESPIIVEINDGNKSQDIVTVASKYDSETGRYIVNTKVIDYAGDATDASKTVTYTVKDVEDNFIYTVTGNKLTVKTEKGTVAESTVTEIGAKIPVLKEDGTRDVDEQGNPKWEQLTSGAKVPFNTKVTATGNDIVSDHVAKNDDGLKIKKPGDNDFVPVVENEEYTKAGTYTLSRTVKGFDDKDYTVTFTFTIEEATPLTTDNFAYTLTSSQKKEGQDAENYKATGVLENGVVTFTIPAGDVDAWKAGNFTISAAQAEGDKHGVADLTAAAGIVTRSGSTVTATEFDKDYTYKFGFDNDETFGTKSFEVKWKVVAAEAEIEPEWNTGTGNETLDANPTNVDSVNLTQVQLIQDAVKQETWAEQGSLDTPEKKIAYVTPDITFEYVAGKGEKVELDYEALGEDTHENLPNEHGIYTIYVLYKGQRVYAKYINLLSTSAEEITKLEVKDAVVTYTDDLTAIPFDVYTTDKDENQVKVAVKTGITLELLKAVKVNKNADGTYPTVSDADFTAGDDSLKPTNNGKYLDAGDYKVQFKINVDPNKNTAVKDVERTGVDGTSFEIAYAYVTVNKKALTADMVTINPIVYNEGVHDIVKDGKVAAADSDNPAGAETLIAVKITAGTAESEVGTYKATVSVEDTDVNYTGSAQVDWTITNAQATADKNVWFDDTQASIKDNGNLRFIVKRAANTKLPTYEEGPKAGQNKTVKRFGLVLDKAGKVTSETDGDAKLLLGTGFTESKIENGSDFEYKVNIAVEKVDQKVFARPFILYDDDTVEYGETRLFTLEQQAKALLNLTIAGVNNGEYDPQAQAITSATIADAIKNNEEGVKDQKPVSGYVPSTNKYFVYETISQLDKVTDSTLVVEKFGVVVDKKGTFGKDAQNVNDNLVLGKGFIEGNYNKNSTKLTQYEYGANITPQDSVTGIWVRGYVDLGNDLVVYTDSYYYDSASEYYGFDDNTVYYENGKLYVSVDHDFVAAKFVDAKLNKIAEDKVKVTKVGVVVDKKNTITDAEDLTHKVLLGKGLVEGKKEYTNVKATEISAQKLNGDTEGYYHQYGANITINNDKTYGRSYVVLDVDGTEVTVYGKADVITPGV